MEQNNKPQFVIDDDPIVDWPVTVKLPAAGGEFTEYQFIASMRVVSPLEYEQIFGEMETAADQPHPKMSATVELNVPIFQRLITGWQGVADRDGNAVDYSPEKLAGQIIGPRGPALSAGIWRAINEVRYGARLGN